MSCGGATPCSRKHVAVWIRAVKKPNQTGSAVISLLHSGFQASCLEDLYARLELYHERNVERKLQAPSVETAQEIITSLNS